MFHGKQQRTLTIIIVIKMLWRNASITKECSPPAQCNEFAAVKLTSKFTFFQTRPKHLCYAVILNKSLTS